MNINKIVSSLIRPKSIISKKDGTEFLTEDLKKEVISEVLESLKTRIPAIIETELEYKLEHIEDKRYFYDEEYDFFKL